MKEITKVVGFNLVILLAYSIVLGLVFQNDQDYLGFPIYMMFAIGIQTIICFFTAIVFFILNKSDYGLAFIIAFLIVPLVGASFCFGGAALRENF